MNQFTRAKPSPPPSLSSETPPFCELEHITEWIFHAHNLGSVILILQNSTQALVHLRYLHMTSFLTHVSPVFNPNMHSCWLTAVKGQSQYLHRAGEMPAAVWKARLVLDRSAILHTSFGLVLCLLDVACKSHLYCAEASSHQLWGRVIASGVTRCGAVGHNRPTSEIYFIHRQHFLFNWPSQWEMFEKKCLKTCFQLFSCRSDNFGPILL